MMCVANHGSQKEARFLSRYFDGDPMNRTMALAMTMASVSSCIRVEMIDRVAGQAQFSLAPAHFSFRVFLAILATPSVPPHLP